MDAKDHKRMIALLGMLGSNHDGEVLNAARLAQRFLGEEGLTWEEYLTGHVGSSTNNGDQRYRDGYADGYRKGLAEGHAQRPVRTTPMQTWVSFARELIEGYEDDLNDWEQGFVSNYVSRGWGQPTPKQRAVFERIAEKLGMECPE